MNYTRDELIALADKFSEEKKLKLKLIDKLQHVVFAEWLQKQSNEETAKDLPKCNCHDLQYGNERPCPVHG